MQERKSFVGMSVCFFCRETVSLLIHKRMAPVIPERVQTGEACQKCQSALDAGGIFFIEVRDGEQHKTTPYRTGRLWAITREAFDRMGVQPKELYDEIVEKQVCWIPESDAVQIFPDQEEKTNELPKS